MTLPSRTAFYGLALFTACLQTLFGTLAGFINGHSRYLYIFGKIAGLMSLLTWLWIAVLLGHNSRPNSSKPLTRSLAHFVSFIVIAIVWLALGVMLATQMPPECDAHTLWCTAAAFSTSLAFLTSLFSAISASIVYISAQRSGAGLSVNVAQARDLAITNPRLV
ncbi:hypothetical protein AMATHDRAFT_67428 [Amanita thiersii Skay4041]|uniref:MARVEL domain-containing protein n=1 Tax=Amanita thiersii Skay4041 TaxID=703135 RepID=A0A2A9N9G9_9AGAR|nr:hypothetical protein AMATHDRAFT_67428 [Amanita thiersii Skay4041]